MIFARPFFSTDDFTDLSYTGIAVTGVLMWISLFLFWKFMVYVYQLAEGGIHYVTRERNRIDINVDLLSPFYLEIDDTAASFPDVKCILKCERTCYVQAFWGMPIHTLLELLNKERSVILNSVSMPESQEHLRCVHVGPSVSLASNVEKVVEFQKPLHLHDTMLYGGASFFRKNYPLVVLMVLCRTIDSEDYPHPFVIASAYAVHVPDNSDNKPRVIEQYLKLSSGHVGQLKKIFYTAPAEEGTYNLCLICYSQPASVVQLSCLHCCLCPTCYFKCDKCPLCRNAAMNYFELPYNFDAMRAADQSSSSEDD